MRLRTTLLLGLLTGCATTASSTQTEAPAEAAPASGKVDLEALAARELAPLSKQPLSAPDGSFTGEVEAAGAPTLQQEEGVLLLSVPLGTGSPLSCFVYSQPLDVGGALYQLVQMAGQRTDLQLVRTTDVRLIGDSPVVYAEAQYLVDTPKGKAAGHAKMMVFSHDELPLVCTHDELGYAESFKRITSALAGSLKSAGETPPAPRYFSFSILRVKGNPVGFEKTVMRDAAGGARLSESESSFLIPRSPTDVVARDSVSSELADKDGKLVSRDYARANNGELDIQMSLQQVQGREYHYEGKYSGKELNGNFTAPAELASEPGSARLIRERLLTGKDQELTLYFYTPSSNPVEPMRHVLRKGPAGARELSLEIGSVKGSITVDAHGMIEKVVVPLGGDSELVQERVTVRGTP
ncbi:hypothetical protein NR798_47355 [Archangium gephyra]|uniref:hypothetical protein n=1 Tax=Archangium gephyra TaxID=48 RepID=UPI0035D4F57F